MRLFLMHLGQTLSEGLPIPGYLVQTDIGQNVLIDSGLAPDFVSAYKRGNTGFRVDEEDFILNRLSEIGLGANDIHYVICTHFDVDHAGNHDQFPHATLIVQREHLQAARSGHFARFASTQVAWGKPGLVYQTVEGDTEVLPGITLINTSGHVPGHQSVLLRLPRTGTVLLSIDAIQNSHLLDPQTRQILRFDMDEAGVRASTAKLVALAEREKVAMMIFGHDPEQWPTLHKAPDFYS